jgi:dihydroneopterin aldolase
MKFYAYHGCFSEEQIIGNEFLVDISFEYDTSEAETTDDLQHTIDYQAVYQLIKTEMEIKSKLLENVAHRILYSVKTRFPETENIILKISKLNPPVGGKVEKVSLTLKKD